MKKLKKYTSYACLFSLLFVFLCPANVFASTQANYTAQNDINIVLKYTTGYSDGHVEFDTDSAKANGESNNIIEIGELVNEFSTAYYNASNGISVLGVPVYGNWCGPGYGSGDPVDYLDAACKAHDECYGKAATYFDCDCDLALINRVNSQMYLMTGEQLQTAKAVVAYFTAQRQAFCCDGC